jgi:hypothetical protein
MSILLSTSLIDCNFIPGFIASGSRMIFENSTTPTSWTKDVSLSTNGVALRVVNGTLSPGGITSFSQVLTQRSVGLSLTQVTAGVVVAAGTANITTQPAQARATFSSNAALEDLPNHTHIFPSNDARPVEVPATPNYTMPGVDQTLQTTQAGASAQHAHTITVTAHSHPVQSPHPHLTTGQHSHTVPVSGSQENFSVFYIDVIIASKD